MIDSKVIQSNDTNVINEIIRVMKTTILTNYKPQNDSTCSTFFSSKVSPFVSVDEYIMRVINYCNIEGSTLIIALIYLERICNLNDFRITFNNFHKLFLISVVLASKFNEDRIFTNHYYAKVGGIKIEKFSQYEKGFLVYIRFNLYINQVEYEKYFNFMDKSIKSRNKLFT